MKLWGDKKIVLNLEDIIVDDKKRSFFQFPKYFEYTAAI